MVLLFACSCIKECIDLCKKDHNRSSFRFVNVEQLKHFKWETLYDDMKMRAPTLFAILSAACGQKSKE